MEIFIIPLIAFAVWVLQYVFKPPEENNKQQPTRPRPPNTQQQRPRPQGDRPRRPANDLDRFLEESKKRKDQEERRPVVLAEIAPDQPMDRSETLERERKAQSARPKQSPAQSRQERRPPPRPLTPIPEPIRRPPLREAPVPVVVVEPAPVHPSIALVPPPPSPPATITGKRVASPVLKELLQIMRRPQGTVLAVILHEILEPPMCMRRPGERHA